MTERTELETIVYEKDGPIARIVMNTPEKANIQTAQQVWDFEEVLPRAAADEEVKVLIIKGTGKGFCAGHAIVEREEMPKVYPTTGPTFERTWKVHNYDLFLWPPLHLFEFPKATISQVHGYCVGGGTHYGLTTDIVIASDDAYFQYPPLQGFGMPSGECSIEPWVFMNWRRAAYYLYLAEVIDAQKALAVGLVNEVVPRDELDARVEAIARHIAQAPLTTLMATKANLKRAWELMGMRVHWQSSNDLVALASLSADVQALVQQVLKGQIKPAEMARRQARAAESPDT